MKSLITYDDFTKLDIRIGTVVSVEVVEDADKLLRCMVNVGDVDEEGNAVTRQIVSGIREHFDDPQVLVGKQFPYVINLEPRTIRGYESHGMILAGSHDGTLSLLSPTEEIPAGTKIA